MNISEQVPSSVIFKKVGDFWKSNFQGLKIITGPKNLSSSPPAPTESMRFTRFDEDDDNDDDGENDEMVMIMAMAMAMIVIMMTMMMFRTARL